METYEPFTLSSSTTVSPPQAGSGSQPFSSNASQSNISDCDGEPWSPDSGSECSLACFPTASDHSDVLVRKSKLRSAIRTPIARKSRLDGFESASIRHVPWRREGEALQVPFHTKLGGQALLVGVGDSSISAYFALVALGIEVIVILSDLSVEVANAVSLNLPGALCVPLNRLSSLDFAAIFSRRSIAATFVGGSDRAEFMVDILDKFSVPTVYWACAECYGSTSDEPMDWVSVDLESFGYLKGIFVSTGRLASVPLQEALGKFDCDEIEVKESGARWLKQQSSKLTVLVEDLSINTGPNPRRAFLRNIPF